ncbi:hypothetical protein GCM10009798_14190 [Nocardioides panacihumi]|uniref:DUF222 domain-containing protein n=1 Tax=Nocardioides panacihumi TaxID=400774 RepID=A0ABP5C1A4_9ACTN
MIELGKLTWAAVELEDRVDAVCHCIRHTNPREDRRAIGQKIRDARSDLRTWSEGSAVREVDGWLAAAASALESRNAFLHATPLAVFDGNQQPVGVALAEMPRTGRNYNERPMTVKGVREVIIELEAAKAEWVGAIRSASQNRPRL